MKKEDKDLLLQDLSSRLPYGVILNCCNLVGEMLYTIDSNGLVNNDYDLEEVKPYLYPLSSMTEEQKKESPFESSLLNAIINGYVFLFEDEELTVDDIVRMLNWFNKNHFDYRGLISKGLAIDCTNLNIY